MNINSHQPYQPSQTLTFVEIIIPNHAEFYPVSSIAIVHPA